MTITEPDILVACIFLFAVTVQTLAGFGLGLVALPLLIPLLGIKTAAPVVALVNLVAIGLIFLRYRHAFRFKATKPLIIAGALGVPIGVWGVKNIPEPITLTALGFLILGYSVYAFAAPQIPRMRSALWGYGLGFISGICGGAYNSSGPASVVYAHSQGWSQETFKSNLQGYFILNSIVINLTHLLNHNYTPTVWSTVALAIPGTVLGMILGVTLSHFIGGELFRRLVLILLFILGLRLILSHLL
jgi:uncharacterized protein